MNRHERRKAARMRTKTIAMSFDDIVTRGDVFVMLAEGGTHTFVAANKAGRDATLRTIEEGHPDKAGQIHIAWRDAGEGWPDTWLGFSFATKTDRPMAAKIAMQGVRVFHWDGKLATYLVPPGTEVGAPQSVN